MGTARLTSSVKNGRGASVVIHHPHPVLAVASGRERVVVHSKGGWGGARRDIQIAHEATAAAPRTDFRVPRSTPAGTRARVNRQPLGRPCSSSVLQSLARAGVA